MSTGLLVSVALWCAGAVGWLLWYRERVKRRLAEAQLEDARIIASEAATVAVKYRTARVEAETREAAAAAALEAELGDVEDTRERIERFAARGDGAAAINDAFDLEEDAL